MDCGSIKGFNYQPGYGTSGLELWRNFDAAVIDRDLALGKQYFPQLNAIRLWLSLDAWQRDHARYESNFDTALAIAAKYGIQVMPVLFNRWHDSVLDYGGIYLDHFVPAVSWLQSIDQPSAFARAVFGEHANDPRIFAWDLCNEPFSYNCSPAEIPEIVQAEYDWLAKIHRIGKDAGTVAPITTGIHMGHGREGIRQIEPISDILSIHPYWTYDSPPHSKESYEALLDDYVEFAAEVGKPLVATETCWGHLDDAKRVEIVRYTLTQLKVRKIGWLVYLLSHSLIADAHQPQYGPVGAPGYLGFIEADGSLRAGHDVFNDF